MAAKEFTEKFIAENPIAVFSKTYCPYCRRAKSLLKSSGANASVIELDQRDDGIDIQNYLHEKTGQSTVPNIFIDGNHIGGSDDLAALDASGKLRKLLAGLTAGHL